jgi:hypothetical protein
VLKKGPRLEIKHTQASAVHRVPEGTEFGEESNGDGGKTSTRAMTERLPAATPAGFLRTCDPVPSKVTPVVVH